MPIELKGNYYTAREIWLLCGRNKHWFISAKAMINNDINPITVNNSLLYTEEDKQKFKIMSDVQKRN